MTAFKKYVVIKKIINWRVSWNYYLLWNAQFKKVETEKKTKTNNAGKDI